MSVFEDAEADHAAGKIHALVLDPDGTVSEVKLGGYRDYFDLVGGYLEAVSVPGGVMWINEEGRLRRLPPNAAASMLYSGGVIVGTAVLTGPTDEDGEATCLTILTYGALAGALKVANRVIALQEYVERGCRDED